MLKNRSRQIISLVLNVIIVVFTVRSILQFFIPIGGDETFLFGAIAFEYFTVLSNIFIALISIVIAVFNVINLVKDTDYLPLIVERIKYVSCCAIGVTMLTVIFFLGPTQGWGIMYYGVNLYMHLLSPLLAIASFLLFEAKPNRKFYETTYGILPVLVYGIVYLINVIPLQNWADFYGFNNGGYWYISFPLMLAASYGISVGIHYLAKLSYKLQNKEKPSEEK